MPGWLIIVLAAAVLFIAAGLCIEIPPDPDPYGLDGEDWDD